MPATKIAVIETRLPYTDRRALSEAWFSALHLAHDPATSPAVVRPANARADIACASKAASLHRDEGDRTAARRERAPALERAARRAAHAGLDAPMRRAGDARPGALAASAFERARSYPPFRTSLTLEGANGTRVHLIVRRVGPTLHVVALCPPSVEQIVRRALASADIHFRARGERLRLDVRDGGAKA